MSSNTNKYLNIEIDKSLLYDLQYLVIDFNLSSSVVLSLDKLLYVIHKIFSLRNQRKFSNLDKVPLYSKVLRYELGPDYRVYLNFLLDNHFITTDNYYRVGHGNNSVAKCKCYGIYNKYSFENTVKYEVKQTCLVKKILKWRESYMDRVKDDELLNEIHNMMEKITIDYESAEKYLNDLFNSGKITKNARNLELSKCKRINDKESFDSIFLIKDSYGRVHTNYTNISKHIRENFLYINGEKAIGIDIKSSQPALLHCVFDDYLNSVKGTQSYIDDNALVSETLNGTAIDIRDKYVNRNNSYSGDHIFDGYVEYKLDTFGYDSYKEMVWNAERELALYKSWLETDIYNEFSSRMSTQIPRKKMKKLFVTHIFSTGWGEYLEPIREVWFKFFPTLHKILSAFKAEDYKNMAYRLQKDESSLVYGDLYSTLKMSGIDTFTTVHDSIIVPESQLDNARSLFNVVLTRNNIPTTAI